MRGDGWGLRFVRLGLCFEVWGVAVEVYMVRCHVGFFIIISSSCIYMCMDMSNGNVHTFIHIHMDRNLK